MTKKYNISKFLMIVLLGFASLNAMHRGNDNADSKSKKPESNPGVQESESNANSDVNVEDDAKSESEVNFFDADESEANTGGIIPNDQTSVPAVADSSSDSNIIEAFKDFDNSSGHSYNIDTFKKNYKLTEFEVGRLQSLNLILFKDNHGVLFQLFCKNKVWTFDEVSDVLVQSELKIDYEINYKNESIPKFLERALGNKVSKAEKEIIKKQIVDKLKKQNVKDSTMQDEGPQSMISESDGGATGFVGQNQESSIGGEAKSLDHMKIIEILKNSEFESRLQENQSFHNLLKSAGLSNQEIQEVMSLNLVFFKDNDGVLHQVIFKNNIIDTQKVNNCLKSSSPVKVSFAFKGSDESNQDFSNRITTSENAVALKEKLDSAYPIEDDKESLTVARSYVHQEKEESTLGGFSPSTNDLDHINKILNHSVVKAKQMGTLDAEIEKMPEIQEWKKNNPNSKNPLQDFLNDLAKNKSLFLNSNGLFCEVSESSGLKKVEKVTNTFSQNTLKGNFVVTNKDSIDTSYISNFEDKDGKLLKKFNEIIMNSKKTELTPAYQDPANSNLEEESAKPDSLESKNLKLERPPLKNPKLDRISGSPKSARTRPGSPKFADPKFPILKEEKEISKEEYEENFFKESVFAIIGAAYKLSDVSSFLYLASLSVEEQRGILGFAYEMNDVLSIYISGIGSHRNGNFVNSLGKENIYGAGAMIGALVSLTPSLKLLVSGGAVKYSNRYSWGFLISPMYSHAISDSVDIFVGFGAFFNNDSVAKDSKDQG